MPDIQNGDDLGTNHVGFGSWFKRDPTEKWKQISSIAEIVDEATYDILPSITPKENEVIGKVAKPIVKEQSALAAIQAVLSSARSRTEAMREETKGTIKHLVGGGTNTTNFEGWSPISTTRTQGAPLDEDLELYIPIPHRGKGYVTMPQTNLTKADGKKLQDKLKELGKVTPLKRPQKGGKDKKAKVGYHAPVHSTPLVHYYESRYLASMITDQADEAMNLDVKGIERITKPPEQLAALMRKAIDISPDQRTGVDAMFDMMPIPTILRYRDKDTPAIANQDLIQPETVDMGLLQKAYSMLDNTLRREFNENVADIIMSLPIDVEHQRADKTLYSVDTEIIESVLVWIEEIELQQARRTINLRVSDAIDAQIGQMSTMDLPLHSTIAIPGWMMLEYSEDNGSELLRDFHPRFQFSWPQRGEMDKGLPYLESLYDVDDDDSELSSDDMDYIDEAWEEVMETASSIWFGTILEMGSDFITIDFDPGLRTLTDGATVRFDRRRLLENEWTDAEKAAFRGKYGFGGRRTVPSIGLKSSRKMKKIVEDPNFPLDDADDGFGESRLHDMGFDLVVEEGDGLELAWPGSRGKEESTDPIEEDIGLSRAFQALGDILMNLVYKNGYRVGSKEKSLSQFDKAITGLLGTYAEPGPAAYHAQLHQQLLYEQAFAAMRSAGDAKGLVSIGHSLVFEQYSKNPAKLMCIWMMTDLGLIDIGQIENGVPKWFKLPSTQLEVQMSEASLMNTFAVIILSYYRLSFFPLRMRSKQGGEGRLTANLKKMWPRLVADARKDSPEAYPFAGVLRFLADSEKKLTVEIPAWMPVMPEDFASKQRERRTGEVVDFLQWSFGSNPLSVENFCEVAAAYHAAKALSYFKPGDYPDMVRAFLDAVEAERGEGFLMAVLMAYNADAVKLGKALKPLDLPAGRIQVHQLPGA